MKILCVLYDDPKGGMPKSYPLSGLPKLGMAAIESLKLAKYNTLVGLVDNTIINTPISDVINATNKLSNDLYRLNKIISR